MKLRASLGLFPLVLVSACGLSLVPDAESGPDASTEDASVTVDGSRPNDAGATDSSRTDGAPDASTASPALVISTPTGTATAETGTQVTFTVKLATKPSARVTVPLVVSRTDEATLDSTELVFDETSFDVPRTVTVTGKDDALADGDQPFTVEVGPARGAGSGYEGVAKKTLSFVNQDDDTAGFLVVATANSVTEKGSTTTFTVRLRTQPTADVTVSVTSSDPSEGVTDVTSLVFGPSDWNVPKSVQVAGVDDDLDDGDITYGIVLGKAVSTDAAYSGLDPVDPTVTTLDDDAAALVVGTPSGLRTSELGTQVTFEVHLAAEPTSPVTVPIASSDTTEATVSPSSVVFGPTDWKTPRTVTVTGVADATADGAQPYKVRLGPSTSAAATFAGLVAEVSLVNDDNPLPAYVDYSINHLLATGQSNSTANGGTRNDDNQGAPQFQFTPAHPTFTNLMFDTGVFVSLGCTGGGCAASTVRTPASFVPIAEGDRFLNYAVETISSAMANRISALATGTYFAGTPYTKHDVLVSQHGRSGYNYACLRKGGCAYLTEGNPSYADGMRQVDSGMALAQAAGRSYVVRGVTFIHGEDDHYSYGSLYPWPRRDGAGNLADYADALSELQSDYQTDIRAKTGQAEAVPLFVVQMQGWTNTSVSPSDPDYVPPTSSPIPVQQYRAHKANPNVVLVAPGYMLKFNDCLHFNGFGQRRLGEYIAKAYAKWVFEGKKWEPTGPTSVTRAGNVVTVKFHVPVPPLVLDTVNVSNPGNFGFRYLVGGTAGKVASGTAQTITNVAVTAPDTVTITLAATPTGANQRLEYANYFDNAGTGRPGCPGPTLGVRGNLRDSDPATSTTGGLPLYNWGVTFELPVPYAGP